ncbi:hypothetical protein DER45DRAFT_623925 [Fusarium avenaceum]|nr:hypothetical protein DER45DRAFT_623925 [Fusarium avenaceum]
MAKTYNSGDSLVVTDPTTNTPVSGLTMGERTGSRIFHYLWSYVQEGMDLRAICYSYAGIGPLSEQRPALSPVLHSACWKYSYFDSAVSLQTFDGDLFADIGLVCCTISVPQAQWVNKAPAQTVSAGALAVPHFAFGGSDWVVGQGRGEGGCAVAAIGWMLVEFRAL